MVELEKKRGERVMGKMNINLSDKAEKFVRSNNRKKGDISRFFEKWVDVAEQVEAGVLKVTPV
jgi:hypothetical protein